MLSIIKTGGKQYAVREGVRIKVDKLEGNPGDAVVFEEVLATGDEKAMKVGTPFVEEARVEAKIIAHGRYKKVMGIKHKPKKRYKVKFGHRQTYTEVEIVKA